MRGWTVLVACGLLVGCTVEKVEAPAPADDAPLMLTDCERSLVGMWTVTDEKVPGPDRCDGFSSALKDEYVTEGVVIGPDATTWTEPDGDKGPTAYQLVMVNHGVCNFVVHKDASMGPKLMLTADRVLNLNMNTGEVWGTTTIRYAIGGGGCGVAFDTKAVKSHD